MEKNKETEFIPLRNKGQGTLTSSNYSTVAQESYDEHFYKKNHTMNAQDLENLRWRNGIEVEGESCPAPTMSFQEAGVDTQLLDYLKRKGIETPTAIQMQGISCLNNGRDVIGIAPTGSGKTLAYLLPFISMFTQTRKTTEKKGPLGLIVVPTRELMQQIVEIIQEMFHLLESVFDNTCHRSHQTPIMPFHHSTESPRTLNATTISTDGTGYRSFPGVNTEGFQPQSTYTGITGFSHMSQASHTLPNWPRMFPNMYTPDQMQVPFSTQSYSSQATVAGFCGGVKISDHIEILQKKNVTIIVATPGRLLDLTDRGFISFENTSYIVLDECDKMLDMGMEEQLRKVVSLVSLVEKQRQFSLWSATLPESLERLARSAVFDPIIIYVGVRDFINQSITQNVIFMHTYQKEELLLKTLRSTPYPPVIVFASTKDSVDAVTSLLVEEQFHVCGIHSDKEQDYRFRVMSAFRRGKVDVLVATDLASRGLDIPEVTHVINYDLPDNIEDYIHRCGRTGRFGRPGLATSFLTLTCKIAEELKGLLQLSQMPIPKQLEDTKQFGGKVVITQFGDRLSL